MSSILVVPCYNESARWDADYWSRVTATPDLTVIFVNDGSSDDTQRRIDATCEVTGATSLELPDNSGKGEALRHGLVAARELSPDVVGYLDADGAFPSEEVSRLVSLGMKMLAPAEADFDAVWSARVLMAGREIERHASRHYIGRVITTLVSPLHKYAVYDTQSGFKLFRNDDGLAQCLATPFTTRWFPDIELLLRWGPAVGRPMRIWEEPVMGWHDVAGSKMNRSQYVRLVKDLSHLYRARARSLASLFRSTVRPPTILAGTARLHGQRHAGAPPWAPSRSAGSATARTSPRSWTSARRPSPASFPPRRPKPSTKVASPLSSARTCGLAQLDDSFPADVLYGDNYGYRSGLNASMVQHLARTAHRLEWRAGLQAGDTVLDIGANDGSLLRSYDDDRRDPRGHRPDHRQVPRVLR